MTVRVFEMPGGRTVHIDLTNGLTISFLVGHGYSGQRTSEVAFWSTGSQGSGYSKPADFPAPAPAHDDVYGWVSWETIVEYVQRIGIVGSESELAHANELLALPPVRESRSEAKGESE